MDRILWIALVQQVVLMHNANVLQMLVMNAQLVMGAMTTFTASVFFYL